MGYDLTFWKYKNKIYLDNQEVYEKCSDEEIVDGLEELPIDSIKKEIGNKFSGWNTTHCNNWEDPNGKGAFQISNTTQFLRFDCYDMDGEDMNRIIDILFEFDCPLYDSQVSKRFDNA